MTNRYPWDVLGLDGPSDERSVRRRYAALAKVHRPDTDPDGFQRLRAAYETALREAEEARSDGPPTAARAASAPERPSDRSGSPDSSRAAAGLGRADDEAAIDVASNLQWRGLLHGLIEASGLKVDSEPGLMVVSVPANPEALQAAVQQLLAHPANENLNVARETEHVLVTLAARSPSWPIELVERVWAHYQLDQRLAFTEGWHPVHQIQRRIDEAQQWTAVLQQARLSPRSPQGMLFRPPGWRERIQWWFSATLREESLTLVHAVRERAPARLAELNPAAVDALERLAAHAARLPLLGPLGLLLLIVQALLLQMHLAHAWPTQADGFPNQFWVWCAIGYAGLLAAKRWWLPRAFELAERHPRSVDGLELLSVLVLVGAHGAGGASPVLWSIVGLLAGALLLTVRALHGRHRIVFRLPIGAALGGVLLMLGLGLLPFLVTALAPLHLLWPLMALVALHHHLPDPPVVFDTHARRFVWRSRPAQGVAARPVLVGLCLAVLVWSGLIVLLGDAYRAPAWFGPGTVVVYLPWLLIGWMGFAGSTANTFTTIACVAVAFTAASLLTPSNPGSTYHLMMAGLGMLHTLRWLWPMRQTHSSPLVSGAADARPATGSGWLSRLGARNINPWMAFILAFLLLKLISQVLRT